MPDISVAGKQAGISTDTRSGLFFEIMRLVDEFNPKFVFLENVPAIRTKGLDVVLRELTQRGYDSQWTIVSAAEVGAPHKRERWFLLAYANGAGFQKARTELETTRATGNGAQDMANSMREGLERQRLACGNGAQVTAIDSLGNHLWPSRPNEQQHEWEPPRCIEPRMGRRTDGLPYRTHRIKALGNSVVPQAVEKAFVKLSGLA